MGGWVSHVRVSSAMLMLTGNIQYYFCISQTFIDIHVGEIRTSKVEIRHPGNIRVM